MKPTTTAAFLTFSLALLGTGCNEQEASQSTKQSLTSEPSWVLNSAPAGALSITEAKASATEGDVVTIRGIIGGTRDPLSSASPVFRVVDTGLYNKCLSDDDHCATPWDYCCAAPDDVVSNSATVQLMNADGTPFAGDPTASLDPLDEVVIVGRVGPRPNKDILTIQASGIFNVK